MASLMSSSRSLPFSFCQHTPSPLPLIKILTLPISCRFRSLFPLLLMLQKVKYTPQWRWLREELKNVNREKTPWLIVRIHVPLYNSNDAHFMEGESMRAVFEEWFVKYKVDLIFAGHVHAYERSYRISNTRYNVSTGERYPVPDKDASIYITTITLTQYSLAAARSGGSRWGTLILNTSGGCTDSPKGSHKRRRKLVKL